MSYYHPTDRAKEFAVAALKSIEQMDLLPTPENYELWFVYHSGANPELIRVVNLVTASGDKLTESQCYEIFQRFLSGSKESDTVQNAGSQIQKTIESVNTAVAEAREFATEYGVSLEEVNEKLKEDCPKEEVTTILGTLLADTRTMLDQSAHLETLLQQSAQTMENLQRDLEIARKEAMTDSLTGLANRKSFDFEIKRTIAEVLSKDCETLSLMMMDIDHFKSFNDTFGHQIGDQVLKLVAKTLKSGVKGRDTVARYGGEEFAIILPETALDGGLRVGEILRQEVARKEVINRVTGEHIARITISIGVAEYEKGESIEDVVARADAALYAAKRNGRNQVAAASPKKASAKKA